MELLNQSVCENVLNLEHETMTFFFDQDLMICAGDVENGGRSVCPVSDHHTHMNTNEKLHNI